MKKVGLVSLLVFFLCASPAFAQVDVISRLLSPLADISIAEIYLQYASLVDFFIVFIIFSFIAKFALAGKYAEHSKGVAITVGLMMAVAFALFERKFNFNLGSLGTLAMIIFCSFLVFFIYSILTGFGAGGKLAGAILYIVIYALVGAFFPHVYDWLNYQAAISFGGGVLLLCVHVILIMCVINIIWSVIIMKNRFD